MVWTPDGDVMRRERANGMIESKPHVYPIELDGFESDENDFFLGTGDVEVEAAKTERWEGDLLVLLEVNGEVVECANNDYVSFDADDRQQYDGDFGCKLNLWFF